MAFGQAFALVVVLAVAASLSDESQWEDWKIVGLLALLVLGSDVLVLDAKRFRIGGSFTGLVLAMALLGPAPPRSSALRARSWTRCAGGCAARTCSTTC